MLLSGLVLLCIMGSAIAEKKAKPVKESRRSETREIEQLERQWRTAVMSGDTAVMDRLLSEDFLAISARGTLSDKQQYVYRIANHTTQFAAFDLMDTKIRLQQHSAVAISQAHVAGTLEGKPIEGIFRYTKVYIRGGTGTWHLTSFEATRVSSAAGGASDMDRGVPLEDKGTRNHAR